MQNYKQRQKRANIVKIMIVITSVLLCLVLLDMKIRPAIKTMAAYQAQLYAIAAINNAANEELSHQNVTYSALVRLSKNSEGEITAVETDMLELNRLKIGITEAIVNSLSELEAQNLKIPLGTLFGGQFFSGRGPMITFHVLHVGTVKSDIQNSFDSAGINQTRHRLILKTAISITALVPGYSSETKVSTNLCLAETIIVGVVPGAFTTVTGDERNNISKINDYAQSNFMNK
ncbi:MAG: sporulation protein YunB [Hydrogenoanaerobacterium sp.]